MKFIIADEIFAKYPGYVCGVVVAKNIDNKGVDNNILESINNEKTKIKSDFNLETLAQHPLIQNWRKVYASFGSKPAEFRASSEALIRRTLNGKNVSHINKLVDIYNYVSLKYRTPVGGEDLSKVAGDIHLKFADRGEGFVPLGSDAVENPDVGEVVYVDDNKNVLCRRWNWRESDLTKLTEDTKDAIIVVESMPPIEENTIRNATDDIAQLVENLHASTETFILTKNNPSIEF